MSVKKYEYLKKWTVKNMKTYFSRNELAIQIFELSRRPELCFAEIDMTWSEMANKMYPYICECMDKKRAFDRDDSEKVIETIVNKNHVAFKTLWGLLAMFAHEPMANKFCNALGCVDRDGAKNTAMATGFSAAIEYKNGQSVPTTYIGTSMNNNIRRHNREEGHSIKTPDKRVKAMAIIDDYITTISAIHGKEVWTVSVKELQEVLNNAKISITDKAVNDLMWARVADRSLNRCCGSGSNFRDTDEEQTDWKETLFDPMDNIENNINHNYEEKLYDIVAAVFGDDCAFISQMHHGIGIESPLSFYELEDVFRRYKTVKNNIEAIAARNSEARPFVETINTALRRGGEELATMVCKGTPAMQYLSAAIHETNATFERCEHGDIEVDDICGKVVAGSLNYCYTMAWPKKPPMGDKAIAQHREFKRRLIHGGLDFVAYELEARLKKKK